MEAEETPSRRLRAREELADYLVDIGATLGSYGCPTYRLEDVIRQVAADEGFHAEPFALPTGLMLRLMPADERAAPEVHRMKRLSDKGVDLDKLVFVDELFNAVLEKKVTIEVARARIKAKVAGPQKWKPVFVWAATVASAGAAAVFFSGSQVDVLVASIVGAVIGGSRVLLRNASQRLLSEFLGGMFAATCAWLGTLVWPSNISPDVVVLAGAISLFPGMTFTTGVAEVSQKNLVSGGARLMEAGVTLLNILFGVALVAGFQSVVKAPPIPVAVARVSLGLHWQAAALVISSLSFGILFQCPRRWLWAALLSGAVGYSVTALAVRHLPGHVAAFCAALAVCVLANGLARWTNRPAQLFQLPGMMLLVPGSFGFLSLGDFLRGHTLDGLTKGFTMALVSAALVIGVLVANVVMPPRKLL